MWTQRLTPDRPFVKTARVVGDTMALFHPHGDASIADALARLAQPFSNLVPLLDFHGNVGSPDFSPAAPRYTETRLGQFGVMLLNEVDQGVVPMVENYEGSTIEPTVLPAAYPNLLVNGANGIAVGLSSYLPPHDPREVGQAALMLLDRKSASVDELMTVLPGPSFPSECTVTNGDELNDIYRSGQGRVVVRGAWIVEPVGRSRQQIIITSLPYADTTLGSVEKFIAQVGDALDNGDLAGITAFNDESSNGQTRISVELSAGVNADMITPGLLRFTNLQVTSQSAQAPGWTRTTPSGSTTCGAPCRRGSPIEFVSSCPAPNTGCRRSQNVSTGCAGSSPSSSTLMRPSGSFARRRLGPLPASA